MKRIQNKLLIAFMVISIIPMLVMGYYSYYLASKAAQENINQASLDFVKQINKTMENKVERVNKNLDIIFNSRSFQQILLETDFNKMDGNAYTLSIELDQWLYSIFYGDEDIDAVYVYNSIGQYNYNGSIKEMNSIRQSEAFQQIQNGNGKTVWVSNQLTELCIDPKNPRKFLLGRVIKDTNYKRNLNVVGTVCIVLNENFTRGIYGDIDKDAETGPAVMISDEKGQILMQNSHNDMKSLSEYPFGEKVLNHDSGYTTEKMDNKQFMTVYCTSGLNGWKIVSTMPFEQYLDKMKPIGWLTICMVVLCLLVINIVSFFTARRISYPMSQLLNATKKVRMKDFTVNVPVRSDDEMGELTAGFNQMVNDLNDLFNKAVEEGEAKRKAQIRALQYQINPHFMYNTLGTISLLASKYNVDIVSDMVAVLSRLLRNSISQADKLITIEDEVRNAKDYLYLMQIRYNNRICIECNVDCNILSYRVPGMLLQPLIENALMHGLSGKLNEDRGEPKIVLSVFEQENKIIFKIYDNGRGMSEEQVHKIFENKTGTIESAAVHIGIKNIHDRIRLYFGKDYGLEVDSIEGEYTLIRVVLPCIVEEHEL